MRFLAAWLVALWLTFAPCWAYASGAMLLIPSGWGVAPIAAIGPAPVFKQIITNAGTASVPSATFASNPAVGDWLIAITTETGGVHTPSSGWTDVQTVSNCATAPELVILYHQVQPGDGATFSPITNTQAGTWDIAIADVGTALPSWGLLKQNIVSNCAGSFNVTVSANGTPNTGVFAVGYVNVPTSGSLTGPPTISGVTGDIQQSYINGTGGSAGGIVGAYGILTGTGFFLASATISGSGTNVSEAVGILIFLNP